MGPLQGAFIYLCAAVLAVPVAKRLGLGSVLGYLLAGIAIGPVLGVVGAETEAIKHFAEFGVVMMLFLVGLELRPQMLWKMRARLLGLGGLQVLVSMAVITAAALGFGLRWQPALALGMTLALSSTAIVLQTLGEKGWMKTPAGQSSFSVLLFQDIAVIPMLALLPMLAVREVVAGEAGHHHSVLDGLPAWLQTLSILGVIGGIIAGGPLLMRPFFRFIAASRLREIFTAAALLLVVGVALLMGLIGLSAALGTFLAGVVLSGSEYRHELESDIEPFKGLLLGLFFISVGAGIDFGLLAQQPGTILGLAVLIMAGKFLILWLIGRAFGLRGATCWLFALGLCQAGEFAFVLLGFGQGSGVLAGGTVQVMTLVVALSMLLTPILFLVYEKWVLPGAASRVDRGSEQIPAKGRILVAGIGEFGLITSRMLSAEGHEMVVLEQDHELVERMRQIGVTTYFGDATRPDLLESAGIEGAQLLIAALEDPEQQEQLVRHVAAQHPHCHIIARARSRAQIFELQEAGAGQVHLEALESALRAGRLGLQHLGMHPFQAMHKARAFRRHEAESMRSLREQRREGAESQQYLAAVRQRLADLEAILKADRSAQRHDNSTRGWTPPPRGEEPA